MRLRGKKAIVTGGGSGIGSAICLAFAKEGADVAVNDIDEEKAKKVAQIIIQLGQESMAVKADVSKSSEVKEMVEKILAKWGKIDTLVNNAGIPGAAPISEINDEEWGRMLAVHLSATFYCTRAVIESMLKRKSGKIINISSLCAQMGWPGAVHYSAAKAGIIGFTKALAREVVSSGIIVNAIAPGFICTPMTRGEPETTQKKMREVSLVGRLGRPEEIAALAVHLASGDGDFIVGQIIGINGGAVI